MPRLYFLGRKNNLVVQVRNKSLEYSVTGQPHCEIIELNLWSRSINLFSVLSPSKLAQLLHFLVKKLSKSSF